MASPTDACFPPTEMVYFTYNGNFEMECNAKVLSCEFIDEDETAGEKRAVRLCLDRTVLHAQGGGQPTDIGTVENLDGSSKISIEKVLLDRATGVAMHTGTVTNVAALQAGEDVRVAVDEDNRRILSECHTAGHVIDSAMARCGKLFPATKAYHFLDGPYVEYRGKISEAERPEMLKRLKKAFAELVEEDIETKIQVLPKAEAEEVCNRVAENYFNLSDYGEDTVRIVTVAGWPCPCGGTHVKKTGDLAANKWGVSGFRFKKGMIRVKYQQNCSNDD